MLVFDAFYPCSKLVTKFGLRILIGNTAVFSRFFARPWIILVVPAKDLQNAGIAGLLRPMRQFQEIWKGG